MADDRFHEAEDLFHELLSASPAEREAVLQAANPDATVRREALSLLIAFEASASATPAPAYPAAPESATVIGPYVLEKEIGEGGMGAVYLASRADQQFEKKVAIKLIRAGGNSAALIDRFLRERQILAGMEHPNIARLLDGGLGPDGRPYLVMDYVEGTRLDSFCDDGRLPLRTRLEIFRKICAAVTYAHQNLVIHRDLKPSNILVTEENEPKLLDFGIATVMRTQAEAVDLTVTAGLFLTPLYASPELVRGERITVATDVYSLGVILYELLCGRSPYDPFTLSPASLIHAITTADPSRPSHPALPDEPGAESAETIAAYRQETPLTLAAKLRGDLDSIVLKSLAKSTADRYATVEQFSDDIGRYLSGQPVKAVNAGALYRTRKFLLRHRAGVAAAGAIVLLLIAGVASTLWQARIAEHRFNDTRQLAKYLLFDLYSSVQKLPGSTPIQAEMASQSLAYLDNLSASKTSDHDLQNELAEGYLRAGNVLGNPFAPNLGKRDEATASYRKALALVEPLAAADHRAALTRARVLLQLGGLQTFAAKTEAEGVATTRNALQLLETFLAATPGDIALRVEIASANQFLGRQLTQSGGWVSGAAAPEARRYILRARDLLLSVPVAERGTEVLKYLALNHNILAVSRSSVDPRASLPEYTASLAYLSQINAKDQQLTEVRRLRASTLLNRGWDEGQVGDFPASIRDIEEGKEILLSISNADPRNMAAIYHCTNAYRNLGIVQGYAHNYVAAIDSLRQVVKLYDRLIQGEPLSTHHPLHRAEALVRIGDLLVKTGRPAEAVTVASEGLAYLVKLAEAKDATSPQLLDASRWLLTSEVLSLRDPQKALGFILRADPKTQSRDESLAEALFLTGDKAGAIVTIDRLLATLPPTAPGEKPSRSRAEFEASRARYSGK